MGGKKRIHNSITNTWSCVWKRFQQGKCILLTKKKKKGKCAFPFSTKCFARVMRTYRTRHEMTGQTALVFQSKRFNNMIPPRHRRPQSPDSHPFSTCSQFQETELSTCYNSLGIGINSQDHPLNHLYWWGEHILYIDFDLYWLALV